ncbi:unnamed protein product [Ectocarpus sp. CCAP 1310/34]|nr:unnamed protein product [Ectocarpus sp. CCAP 1310/34]
MANLHTAFDVLARGPWGSLCPAVALVAALLPFDRARVQATAPGASPKGRQGAGAAKRHKGSRKRSSGGDGGGGGGGGGGRPERARFNGTRYDNDTDAGAAGAEDTDGTAEVDVAVVRSDRTHDGAGRGSDEVEAGTERRGESEGGATAEAEAGPEAVMMKKTRGAPKHSSNSREATQRREVARNSQDEKPDNDDDDNETPREEGGGSGGNRHETNAPKERAQESGADGSGGDGQPGNISGNVGAAAVGAALAELRETDEREGGKAEVVVAVGADDANEDQEVEEEEEAVEECKAIGPCVWCEKDEVSLEYCKETGRREEVRCTVQGAAQNMAAGVAGGAVGVLPSSVKYRSCPYAEEDEFLGLLHFWIFMVAVGVSACFCLRKRQQKGGSLYSRRAK